MGDWHSTWKRFAFYIRSCLWRASTLVIGGVGGFVGLVLDVSAPLDIPFWGWASLAVLCVMVGQYMVYAKMRDDYDSIQARLTEDMKMKVEPMPESGITAPDGSDVGLAVLEVKNRSLEEASFSNRMRCRAFDSTNIRVASGIWQESFKREMNLRSGECGTLLLARTKFDPEAGTYSLGLLAANPTTRLPDFIPMGREPVQAMEVVLEITTGPRISEKFVQRYVITVDPHEGIVTTTPKPTRLRDEFQAGS